jgi:hypothetical protein
MGFVRAAVVVSICVQLYYQFSCAIVWMMIAMDERLPRHRDFDEELLDYLGIAKVLVAPVSIFLLVAKPDWGKLFTGCAFLVYGIAGLSMPIIAGSDHPMAWWYNTRAYGEGPLISLAFTSLGLVLLFHRQIARLLAGPAPQPDPGTPPPA